MPLRQNLASREKDRAFRIANLLARTEGLCDDARVRSGAARFNTYRVFTCEYCRSLTHPGADDHE